MGGKAFRKIAYCYINESLETLKLCVVLSGGKEYNLCAAFHLRL